MRETVVLRGGFPDDAAMVAALATEPSAGQAVGRGLKRQGPLLALSRRREQEQPPQQSNLAGSYLTQLLSPASLRAKEMHVSATSNLIAMGAVAGAGALGLAMLKAKLASAGGAELEFKFRAKPLLTANELEFLDRLEAAAPDLRFFPQVAMGALMDPAVPRSDGKAYFRLRGMFSQKIVDFVAQRRTDGEIVAIIELDDRTHNAAKDANRDGMLKSAGYRIVRWNSKTKPDASAIRSALLPPTSADVVTGSPRVPSEAAAKAATPSRLV